MTARDAPGDSMAKDVTRIAVSDLSPRQAKADRIGIRQVFMPDTLPAALVALFVACCSTCIFGTVGAWMPLYLSTEKGWSTAEYSAFYVCWGIVGFFGLWLAGWLADRIGRRVAFIALLLEGAVFLTAWIFTESRLLLWVFGLAWSFGFIRGRHPEYPLAFQRRPAQDWLTDLAAVGFRGPVIRTTV